METSDPVQKKLAVDDESHPAATQSGLTLDFEPKFATLKAKKNRVTLQWKNIDYSITSYGCCGLGAKRSVKNIINGISGRAEPGDVIAIMGPSGAGKTTLLNILAGRVVGGSRGRCVNGELLINGEPIRPVTFRKSVAYVTQEDALFATQSARESLEFSARLRLPANVSAQDRKLLVDDMLESLGLLKVQHTMVGSDLIRGLSGGEKKRVAIGVELVLVSFPLVFSLLPKYKKQLTHSSHARRRPPPPHTHTRTGALRHAFF